MNPELARIVLGGARIVVKEEAVDRLLRAAGINPSPATDPAWARPDAIFRQPLINALQLALQHSPERQEAAKKR